MQKLHNYFVGKKGILVHNADYGIVKSITRKGITKTDYLFKNRSDAMNWARDQLGHNTTKMRDTNGRSIAP